MKASASRHSHDFLSSSFTDLMASLAVIFILLTVVFIRNASKRAEQGKDAVRESLASVLEKNKLPLKQDPNDPLAMSVAVDEKVLKFPLGSSRLSIEGERFLDGFVPALARQLCSDAIRNRLDSVIIEGHTDRSGENTPDGVRKNIQLSQSRSFAVLDRALQAVKGDGPTSECLLKLASATGRGSRIPIEGPKGYDADASRRVEIKIRVKSSEQELKATPAEAASVMTGTPAAAHP